MEKAKVEILFANVDKVIDYIFDLKNQNKYNFKVK
jgi:hypothetical protein